MDDNQHCDNFFWTHTNSKKHNWFCTYAYDNGIFTHALKSTALNKRNFFTVPMQDNDYIISACRENFDIKHSVCIYERNHNCIKTWSFISTHDETYLVNNFSQSQIMATLSSFISYFNSKLPSLDIDTKKCIIFPKKLCLKETKPVVEVTSFLRQIEKKY